MDAIFSLIGGLIIGISSLLLLILMGRMAGISSMISTTLTAPSKDNVWRYCFLMGLILGSFIYYQFSPTTFNYSFLNSKAELIIGGALVGFGVRLGGGCTSGHGVCGIPRLSKRSILAVFIFMITAMVTVYIKRHIL